MISAGSIILAMIAFLSIGYVVGLPASRFLESNLRMRLLLAPALGLSMFGGVAVALFHVVPFNGLNLALCIVIIASISHLLSRRVDVPLVQSTAAPSALWFAVAFVLSLVPLLELIPQSFGESAAIGGPIWDHAKIAIINEITLNGLPPHNPFYSQAGTPNILAYYYVWYFIAACGSVLSGANGWEADVALTGITAVSGLFLIAWITVARCKTTAAAWWILPLLFMGTLKQLFLFVSGNWIDTWFASENGHGVWLYQAAWVPQHLFASATTILAVIIYVRVLVLDSRENHKLALVLGGILATAYGSSVWAGALPLALVLPLLTLIYLPGIVRNKKLPGLALALTIILSTAIVCAAPLILQQLALVKTRRVVEVWIYPVFVGGRAWLDIPGYWFAVLPIFLGILSFGFVVWLFTKDDRAPTPVESGLTRALVLTVLGTLLCAQFLRSVVANNDLGWRVIIPAVMLMMSATAEVIALKFGKKGFAGMLMTALVVVVLSPAVLSGMQFIYAGGLEYRLRGPETEQGKLLTQSPAMWEAVRKLTPTDEAIANNPLFLDKVTLWPGNISWALLSERRNCGTELGLLRAYAAQLEPVDAQRVYDFFLSVFRGQLTEADLRTMKEQYLCKTLLVVPSDGLWNSPLLNGNSVYRLVAEEPGRWRIYR